MKLSARFVIIILMPERKTILATDLIYHIFNRGIDKRITFTSFKEYERALTSIWFYAFQDLPCKLSYFLTCRQSAREEYYQEIITKPKLVEIYCYCLMPNHYHLLLKQKIPNGITIFMRNFQDSYVKYFNIKNERKGSLFYGRFKAKMVETDEQFLHVSRYIHLNPYVSSLVNSFPELERYPFNSLYEYLVPNEFSICQTNHLKQYLSTEEYLKFLKDHMDYAKSLETIKHQLF